MGDVAQFFSNDFMPHGHCYLWLPSILWTNVVSDALIAAAYFSIPIIIHLASRMGEGSEFTFRVPTRVEQNPPPSQNGGPCFASQRRTA